MGNSIIGKTVVMMVVEVEGRGGWWRVMAAQGRNMVSSLAQGKQIQYKPTPNKCVGGLCLCHGSHSN